MLRDTAAQFPTFSEAYLKAIERLHETRSASHRDHAAALAALDAEPHPHLTTTVPTIPAPS
jgi:hypothetical protein